MVGVGLWGCCSACGSGVVGGGAEGGRCGGRPGGLRGGRCGGRLCGRSGAGGGVSGGGGGVNGSGGADYCVSFFEEFIFKRWAVASAAGAVGVVVSEEVIEVG